MIEFQDDLTCWAALLPNGHLLQDKWSPVGPVMFRLREDAALWGKPVALSVHIAGFTTMKEAVVDAKELDYRLA